MRSNPPKGHGLEDVYRHQAQALARMERYAAEEEHALERYEAVRSRAAKQKWLGVLRHAQAKRVRAELDFTRYEAEEAALLARRVRRRKPVEVPAPAPVPVRPRKYEYVLKVDYDADPRSGHGKGRQVFFDLRFRKASGERASTAEMRSLSAGLKMGEVPEGWEFREVLWGRGLREDAEAGIPPRGPGDESDFQNLAPMISQHLRPTEIGEEEVE